jgi:hypothetical protein
MRTSTHTALLAIAVIVGGISLSGCIVDPYKGVPYGYATVGNQPLTPEKVGYQDKVVQPRCETYAKETTPSSVKMGSYYAFNHAQAGAVQGLGYMAELKTAGLTALPGVPEGITVAGAINGASGGYVSGRESADGQRHNTARGCLVDDVEGVHLIPPSEGRRIATGQQPPTSYGAPVEWTSHKPTTGE